jgi:hypothetical protein
MPEQRRQKENNELRATEVNVKLNQLLDLLWARNPKRWRPNTTTPVLIQRLISEQGN